MFELFEGCGTVWSKDEGDFLSSKADKSSCGLAIVSYKPAVEVAEAEERLDALYRLWRLPVDDSFYLFWVHLDSIGAHNKPKVFSFSNTKLAFLNISLESCGSQSGQYFLYM